MVIMALMHISQSAILALGGLGRDIVKLDVLQGVTEGSSSSVAHRDMAFHLDGGNAIH